MAGLYDSLPGYLKAPVPTDTDLATFLKSDHARIVQAHALGFDELLLEHPEILRLASEVNVWRRSDKGE